MAEAVEAKISEILTKYGFKGKAKPGHQGAIVKLIGKIARLRILKDPWFKKPYTVYEPLPWDYLKGYIANLSEAQLKACAGLKAVSEALAGVDRWVRREAIGRVLRGRSYGGVVKKKPKAPAIPVEEAVKKAEAALAKVVR